MLAVWLLPSMVVPPVESASEGSAASGEKSATPPESAPAGTRELAAIGRRAAGGADGIGVLDELPQAALLAARVVGVGVVGGVDDQVVGEAEVDIGDVARR